MRLADKTQASDMRFLDDRAERNFWTAFAEQWLGADRLYVLLCTAIWMLPTVKLILSGAPTVQYGLIITVANALAAVLQWLVPKLYMRHRTAICFGLKLYSSFCASAILSVPTHKQGVVWMIKDAWGSECRAAGSFAAFATYIIIYSKALMSILSGWIGLPIPFLAHLLEQSLSLLITLYNNPNLCQTLKSEQPNAARRLTLLCEGLSLMAVPFHSAPQPLVLINPSRRCEWAFSWIQITAYIMSCCLIYRSEANARRGFEHARLRRGSGACRR